MSVRKNIISFVSTALLVSGVSYAEVNSSLQNEDCNTAIALEHYDAALAVCEYEADKGNPEASMNIGYMYLKGKGVSRDWGQTRRYLEQSVDAGNLKAYRYLGVLYWNGLGVKRDTNKAREMFNLCLEFDPEKDLSCTAQYAETLSFGTNSTQDKQEAVDIYQKLFDNRAYEYSFYLAKQQLALGNNLAAYRNIEFFIMWAKRYGDLSKLRKNMNEAERIDSEARQSLSENELTEGFKWARDLVFAINHGDREKEDLLTGKTTEK